MWAGHVHDYSVWTDLIAPFCGNKAMSHLGKDKARVEVPTVKTLSLHKRRKGYVPFCDALLMFADYLILKEEAHRWPMRAV